MSEQGNTEQGNTGAGVHLDAATWQALLASRANGQGAVDAGQRAMVEHLASGCEQCEAFLATQSDFVDGLADAALMSLAPRAEAALDELGWLKLRRRMAKRQPAARYVAFAVAAGLVLAVGVGLKVRNDEPSWNGLKGSRGPGLELTAARKRLDNGFSRLDDGARLHKDAVLVFRANSTIEGPARVYLQRGNAAPVEVGETALRAGPQEIQTDTGLLGVTLDGEHGDVAVWVVVGEAPFTADAALNAINALGTAELGVARVRVQVE